MSVDWPARLALDLLGSAEACYTAPGAPPAPAISVVLHGTTPALDCPMLAVVLTSVEARPAIAGSRCAVVPRARLTVWVARCYPVMDDAGQPPGAAAEQQASLALAADIGCLWDGLTSAWAAGTLFPNFPALNCETVTLGTSAAQGPLGGLAAWQLPVTVDLTGLR